MKSKHHPFHCAFLGLLFAACGGRISIGDLGGSNAPLDGGGDERDVSIATGGMGGTGGSSGGEGGVGGSGGASGDGGSGGVGGSGGAGGGMLDPCMAPLARNKCAVVGCHGGTVVIAGLDLSAAVIAAPMPLLDRLNRGEPAGCMANVGRIIDTQRPEQSLLYTKVVAPPCGTRMPPGGPLTAAESSCVLSWIRSISGVGGAGGDGGPSILDAASDFDAGATFRCSSGSVWTGGSAASPLMTPGAPCMASGCHTSSSPTPMTMAGTVYALAGLRDDNDCNGVDGSGMAIAVMDDMGMGMEIFPRIQVNSVGNFFTSRTLPASFRVKLIAMGREAVMQTSVTDGNCNSCHTARGNMGALGRIFPQPP